MKINEEYYIWIQVTFQPYNVNGIYQGKFYFMFKGIQREFFITHFKNVYRLLMYNAVVGNLFLSYI